ncbi:uncharacterized protein LOC26526917 [Drosophila erecta]|uniref:Uncharacterized protein n=1 Tax=Drosophila erecta TaxID=7220 RepID=A0A0Q5U2W6_DROER|nr:uncharacterized protein LOC26526917 [Drosophila erecta]KQS43317.1 uncharacterized protein Dere_GG27093 [Drosophila erecta]
MCACPPLLIRISLLLTIFPTIATNIMEIIVYGVHAKDEHHEIAANLNLIACFIALITLIFGIYGTIMKTLFVIRMQMFILISFCLVKIVMWIVCKNLSPHLAANLAHVWFQLNTVLSIVCAVLTVLFCMRLHEQTREFQLGF